MPNKILTELLNCPLLHDVPLETLTALEIAPRHRTYTSNQIILDRNEDSCDVFFLMSGRILAVYWTEDGRELIFGRMTIGSYFGELSALDDAPRSLSVYAHTDVNLLLISQADFQNLINNVPLVRARLLQDMARRIRHLTERSYQASSLSVDKRVRSYLARLALEAGALQNQGEIKDAPTHTEIANSVGSNREAVSRVMSKLKKSGHIENGRQRIKLIALDTFLEQSFF
jgi:CRP/FNR family cyclic AMP-dependent transcriptional regulator